MKENLEAMANFKRMLLKCMDNVSGTDMYIDKNAGVAVLGVQVSGEDIYGDSFGHDSIYVLKKDNKFEEVLDRNFKSGRMFPTGILEDGTGFKYTIKDESGKFHKNVYKF